MSLPTATYRVQLNRDFTFREAAEIVPYLADLGISHLYASPYLRARSGSLHGYDIVDHGSLNPEIGDHESFDGLVNALRRHGMGHILDLVPNHMGVGGDDNAWWLDVLENGESSPCAPFFDIDWRPVKEELRGKVLLPVLGDHYGTILESGELVLTFDEERGEFSARYHEHRFPIDPRTYPMVLAEELDDLDDLSNTAGADFLELRSIMTAFGHLPARTETEPEKLEERQREQEVQKRRLADLFERSEEVRSLVATSLARFRGKEGDAESFDPLHALLERQGYRLAYWQVASDEINYRRFFDINDLAGLRMEDRDCFDRTHRLVLDLVGAGKLDGLRIDHPDGLHDPPGYYGRLVEELRRAQGHPARKSAEWLNDDSPSGEARAAEDTYLIVEKILGAGERLPDDWPVHGTTGYEFTNLVNGLFVRGDGERELDRVYERFLGLKIDFDDLLYERKKLIIRGPLSSELTVLANVLNALARSDRRTRDFTLNGLREALTEVVACFPIYRTYVSADRVSDDDQRYIDEAIERSKRRNARSDPGIYDFIRRVLALDGVDRRGTRYRADAVRFAMKFQQYSAPVMAKGLEDTTFYIYNRLISLNEVGGEPRHFSVSAREFHEANAERARHWPYSMLSTSTHDTKRSEDVRLRIDVLSELPAEWRALVDRWSRAHRERKTAVDGIPAPSRNDEYLLYQTLVGAWPIEPPTDEGLREFRERIEAYMLKAVREAKVHTSWTHPNPEYEEAIRLFVTAVLAPRGDTDLGSEPLLRRAARCGMLSSLSQCLLKVTAPGIPDIYQGNELWDLSLVDPDNRRPVDYARRRELLERLKRELAEVGPASLAASLAEDLKDGRAKLYTLWRALGARREAPALFTEGDYVPLACEGARARHLCAFARVRNGRSAVTIATRWFASLLSDSGELPPARELWSGTTVAAPSGGAFTNLLTGEVVEARPKGEQPSFAAAEALARFPVALLVS